MADLLKKKRLTCTIVDKKVQSQAIVTHLRETTSVMQFRRLHEYGFTSTVPMA